MMYVYAISVVVALAVGGWVGFGLADGRCADRLLSQADAALFIQNSAVARANARGLAERKRAVAAAIKRNNQTRVAQEVSRDIQNLPARLECEWTADERLRFDDLYSAYGYSPGGPPPVVRGALPASPGQ